MKTMIIAWKRKCQFYFIINIVENGAKVPFPAMFSMVMAGVSLR